VSGNRLAQEISLYLRQHARQPVAWQPWDDAALEQARREDRPIILSVGYSACHWCHVMAHESFDDEETARIMNEHFVNIKVDREERPDLDRIYQSAHLLLTGRPGGWPLTMFLLPQERQAFFGGTYFPREPGMHLPGFKDVLLRVLQCYREQRPQVQTQAHSLNTHLGRFFADAPPAAPGQLDPAPLRAAAEALAAASDPRHGGFGGAPKFPMQPQLAFLLHGRWLAPAGENKGPHGLALEGALHTLRQMARGGIYDHLGGGFFRYAVDAAWQIPHFEKMLYDNAQLLSLYSEAWECRRENGFREVVRATAEWLMRDMQDPAGGCYSSLDADDPERGEGAFYLWRREEAQGLLSAAEYERFAACYGLDRPPNFEGAWHLSVHREPRELAATGREPPTEDKIKAIERALATCRAKLYAHRRGRPSHALDRKVLTAWNGMAIKGMATSARIFEQPPWQARRLFLHLPRPRTAGTAAQALRGRGDTGGQRRRRPRPAPPGLPPGRTALPASGRTHPDRLLAAATRGAAGVRNPAAGAERAAAPRAADGTARPGRRTAPLATRLSRPYPGAGVLHPARGRPAAGAHRREGRSGAHRGGRRLPVRGSELPRPPVPPARTIDCLGQNPRRMR